MCCARRNCRRAVTTLFFFLVITSPTRANAQNFLPIAKAAAG